MNLKYYLRGLGLGIFLTAIVMGIAANGRKETLSNEEIVVRAKELGMIEDKDLADYVEKARTETEEKVRKEFEAEKAKMEEADQQIVEQVKTEEADVPEPVVFTVKKGETPYSISERLENDGLVPAASDFDKYLVDNGYDRKIVASEYTIPSDADMDLIARIITGDRIEE